jgi:hypothetical protein
MYPKAFVNQVRIRCAEAPPSTPSPADGLLDDETRTRNYVGFVNLCACDAIKEQLATNRQSTKRDDVKMDEVTDGRRLRRYECP